MKSIIDIHKQIGNCCVSALISEVYVSPKPGLVDRFNAGAHNDMDFFTFIRSITAISPYFASFAGIGCNLSCIDQLTLNGIRSLGVECEKDMFKATNNINTHKGAIFSLGILATAAGYCYAQLCDLSANAICHAAGMIAKPAEKDFLLLADAATMTKGRKLYAAYGIRGIRGEAASGFYSVRKYALPVMRELFIRGGHSKNDVYLHVLLHLMTEVVDTNIIARCGIDAIEHVKKSAKNALSLGGALSHQGRDEIFRMDEEFTKHNISPGGCADLLSVAIALYMLENLSNDNYIVRGAKHGQRTAKGTCGKGAALENAQNACGKTT